MASCIDASVYCLRCKKKVDVKNTRNHSVISRKLKNGLTTNILCAVCDKCNGKVCTILGNQKGGKSKWLI